MLKERVTLVERHDSHMFDIIVDGKKLGAAVYENEAEQIIVWLKHSLVEGVTIAQDAKVAKGNLKRKINARFESSKRSGNKNRP